jgi:hypothetical protein
MRAAMSEHEQTRIGADGRIESQPLTWDREPLYAPETVREGLFDPAAFEQIPGQLAIEDGKHDGRS